jgi:bile acid-coenzyme A ligase
MANQPAVPQVSLGSLMPMGGAPTYHAQRDPGRPMITCNGLTVSRGEFDARANRRARALAACGVGQDDLVTIALLNSVEFYESVFAVWKLGATPNIVSAKLPDAELRAIIDLAKPRVVIGVEAARLPGQSVLPPTFQPDASLSPEPLPERVPRYWKAMTSGGSTGRPKLIVDHSPGLCDPNMHMLRQLPGDTLLNPGPLYHNAPFSMMSTGLFAGAHIVEMVKFDALQALQLIERHRVGWVNFVPTMLHRIWRLPEAQRTAFDLSSLHTVFHMAAACPMWLKEEWIRWLGAERIWELYGGTEGQGRTLISGVEWLAHKGSVGRPQPGCRIAVFDESGAECPPGQVGEIYFLPEAGKQSTYHYVGAEAKSKGNWESIGDLGYTDTDGYLYLVDRRTDLIISGGANIYPAEVEAAIDEHPDVQSSVVIGLPDEDLGHSAHAIVQSEAAASGQLTADGLKQFLSARLVAYKIPRSFEFVRESLRDDAGKVRRTELRDARLRRRSP